MYNIDKIEQLAGVYAKTADDKGYELLHPKRIKFGVLYND